MGTADAVCEGLRSGVPAQQKAAMRWIFKVSKQAPVKVFRAALHAAETTSDLDLSVHAMQVAVSLGQSQGLTWQTLAPDLVRARFGKSKRLRARAALLMGRTSIGSKLPPGVLVVGLQDPIAGYRGLALLSLRFADGKVQDAVLAGMHDEPSSALQMQIATVLSAMRSETAAALPYIERKLRQGIAVTGVDDLLVRIGAPAVDLLHHRLTTQIEAIEARRSDRSAALRALAYADSVPKALLEPIARAARLAQPRAASLAIRALAAIDIAPSDAGFAELQDAVLHRLSRLSRKGDQEEVLRPLDEGLGRMGKKAAFALPTLLPHLDHLVSYRDIAGVEAIVLLGRLGAPARDILPRLLEFLASREPIIDALLPRLRSVVRDLGDDARKLLPVLGSRVDRYASTNTYRLLGDAGAEGVARILADAKAGQGAAYPVLEDAAMRHPELVWKAHAELPESALPEILRGIGRSENPPEDLQGELVEFAGHPDRRIRTMAVASLIAFGQEGLESIRQHLTDYPDGAAAVLLATVDLGPRARALSRQQIAMIRSLPDAYPRQALLNSLHQFGQRGIHALEMLHCKDLDVGVYLYPALMSRDPATRQAAARAAISIHTYHEFFDRAFSEMLQSGTPGDQRWARMATVSLIDQMPARSRARVRLGDFLAEGNVALRIRVLKTLRDTDPPTTPNLHLVVDSLLDPDAAVRLAALHTLTAWGPRAKPARPAIKDTLNDGSESVRDAARGALDALN